MNCRKRQVNPLLSNLEANVGLYDIKEKFENWEVLLLVDVREKDHAMIQTRMIERDIPCEVITFH